MLDFEITKSKLRKKLLAYFFTNQESRLYLREIAVILGEDAGNLSKELARLEKEGIFDFDVRGNQKYFSLNKKYPIYKELESIIFKTIGVEGTLKKALQKINGIEFAFIFGSFAKGEADHYSDIDLMIIGDPNEDQLITAISKLELRFNREINYHIFSLPDWKKNFMKNSFLKNILLKTKIFLIGDSNGLSNIR